LLLVETALLIEGRATWKWWWWWWLTCKAMPGKTPLRNNLLLNFINHLA